MTYQVFPLNEEDLQGCSQLYVETFRHAPWNEAWTEEDAFNRLRNFLSPSTSMGLKLVSNGEVQGFLIGEIEQWNGSQSYYLKEMCVSRSMQRSGLGKALMLALKGELLKSGISRIYLITQRETVPERFYKSLGFRTNESLLIMGTS